MIITLSHWLGDVKVYIINNAIKKPRKVLFYGVSRARETGLELRSIPANPLRKEV